MITLEALPCAREGCSINLARPDSIVDPTGTGEVRVPIFRVANKLSGVAGGSMEAGSRALGIVLSCRLHDRMVVCSGLGRGAEGTPCRRFAE